MTRLVSSLLYLLSAVGEFAKLECLLSYSHDTGGCPSVFEYVFWLSIPPPPPSLLSPGQSNLVKWVEGRGEGRREGSRSTHFQKENGRGGKRKDISA